MHVAADTGLIELLMQWQNAGIAVIAMWAIERAKVAFPAIKTHPVGVSLLPFSPLLLTSLLVWLPVYSPAPSGGERVLLGCILGAVAGQVYTLVHKMLQALVHKR